MTKSKHMHGFSVFQQHLKFLLLDKRKKGKFKCLLFS